MNREALAAAKAHAGDRARVVGQESAYGTKSSGGVEPRVADGDVLVGCSVRLEHLGFPVGHNQLQRSANKALSTRLTKGKAQLGNSATYFWSCPPRSRAFASSCSLAHQPFRHRQLVGPVLQLKILQGRAILSTCRQQHIFRAKLHGCTQLPSSCGGCLACDCLAPVMQCEQVAHDPADADPKISDPPHLAELCPIVSAPLQARRQSSMNSCAVPSPASAFPLFFHTLPVSPCCLRARRLLPVLKFLLILCYLRK